MKKKKEIGLFQKMFCVQNLIYDILFMFEDSNKIKKYLYRE